MEADGEKEAGEGAEEKGEEEEEAGAEAGEGTEEAAGGAAAAEAAAAVATLRNLALSLLLLSLVAAPSAVPRQRLSPLKSRTLRADHDRVAARAARRRVRSPLQASWRGGAMARRAGANAATAERSALSAYS